MRQCTNLLMNQSIRVLGVESQHVFLHLASAWITYGSNSAKLALLSIDNSFPRWSWPPGSEIQKHDTRKITQRGSLPQTFLRTEFNIHHTNTIHCGLLCTHFTKCTSQMTAAHKCKRCQQALRYFSDQRSYRRQEECLRS